MPTILERYHTKFAADKTLAEQARKLLPDGITTDSRYMQPFPVAISHATDCRKWSISGHELIDYWSGHGSLLLGHNPSTIVAAVTEHIQRGSHYSACHPYDVTWAQKIIDLVPSAQHVRFTGSGTEANILAIQMAQAYTGKQRYIRFAGHYHGWPTTFSAQTKNNTMGTLDQTGGIAQSAIVCPKHDIVVLEQFLSKNTDIACILLEPTGGSSGVIPTDHAFLQDLRALTAAQGILLIFDEVVTGFRVAPGGAQEYYDIMPDITTLAKVLAGGMPGGAVAGRHDIMACLSHMEHPSSTKVTHLGTYNGNPISAAAGIAMLQQARTGEPQKIVNRLAAQLRTELNQIIDRHQLDWVVYGEFSFVKFLIGHGQKNKQTGDFYPLQCDHRILMKRGNAKLFQALRLGMLLHGIDISLSSILMTAHTQYAIQTTLMAFEETIILMYKEKII